MTAQDQSGNEWQIRTDIPHPARVYDYWLGGKDNFEVDRRGGEQALREMPEFRDYAIGNRQFLVRATRMLAQAAGGGENAGLQRARRAHVRRLPAPHHRR